MWFDVHLSPLHCACCLISIIPISIDKPVEHSSWRIRRSYRWHLYLTLEFAQEQQPVYFLSFGLLCILKLNRWRYGKLGNTIIIRPLNWQHLYRLRNTISFVVDVIELLTYTMGRKMVGITIRMVSISGMVPLLVICCHRALTLLLHIKCICGLYQRYSH